MRSWHNGCVCLLSLPMIRLPPLPGEPASFWRIFRLTAIYSSNMKTTSHTRGLQRLLSTRGFVFGALFFVLLLGVILWREPLSGVFLRGGFPPAFLRGTPP